MMSGARVSRWQLFCLDEGRGGVIGLGEDDVHGLGDRHNHFNGIQE